MLSRSFRIILIIITLICVTKGIGLIPSDAMAQNSAFTWRDTLYVRVVDSVFVEDEKAIEFTLEMKRPNADWNNDAVLGDMDFYFFYDHSAFDPTSAMPVFTSVHPKVDMLGGARSNLVSAETRFHAGRFLISTRVTNNVTGAGKYEFNVNDDWVELCRVSIPMADPLRNPGIVWDETATGAMTAGGDPILLKLAGEVKNNPKGTVNAKSLMVAPQWVCQGDLLYLYVEDALTSGSDLKFTWRDSVVNGATTTIGEFNAPATGTSPKGYEYQVLGKGDTLVIPNVPGIVDKLYFICDLYDASVHDGITVSEQVFVRDSLYAYFASGTPSANFGMSSDIDTVWKCQGVPAQIYLYVFGTDPKGMQTEFGRELTVHYGYIDKDMNAMTDEIKVKISELMSQLNTVNGLPVGKTLFGIPLSMEKMGKFWINSVTTEYCDNGIGYAPFDTLYIKEVEGNIEYNLPKLSVSIGEKIALDTATAEPKTYKVGFLHSASALSAFIYQSDGVYTYDATTATAGIDTVVYTYTQASCEMKAFRPVEVVENYYLTMKVLLEGPYLGLDENGKDTMRCDYTDLEDWGEECFPRTNLKKFVSPYDENYVLDTTQSIASIATKGVICDWIYIKLLEAKIGEDGEYAYGNYVDSISGFLLQDGSVCGADGNPLKFNSLGDKKYFIVIKHKSHLSTLSIPVSLPTYIPNNFVVDFTDISKIYRGDKGNFVKILTSTKCCLYGGDLDQDGVIGVGDGAKIAGASKIGYTDDINLDYSVNVSDLAIINLKSMPTSLVP